MLARGALLLSKRIPAVLPYQQAVRFAHSYVASDECVLKAGEVYSFTDTGNFIHIIF